MARTRNIKPGFFLNDELAELHPLARLLFAGLWTIADREGRLEDRPKRIKAEILPYDDCDVDQFLTDLHKSGFILRYIADGDNYIQIINFAKHQNPHIKEPISTIPAPPENQTSTIQAQEEHPYDPADPDPLNLKLDPDPDPDPRSSCPESSLPDDDQTSPEQQKPQKKKYKYSEEHMQLAELLRNQILATKPDAKVPANLDSWAETFRLMVERDNREPARIAEIIVWCQKDEFWRANILSADKLRQKFDQLELQMQRSPRADPRDRMPRGFASLYEMREELDRRERERGP